MLEKEKFNINPLNADTLQPNREIRFADVTFAIELYNIIEKSRTLGNWNALSTSNTAEWWTHIQEAAETLKTELEVDITSAVPLTTTYEAYTTMPLRFWGTTDKDYYTKFREAVWTLLENRVRLMELSQICWNGVENAQISLQSIWGNPYVLNAEITGADMEEIVGKLITSYMGQTGRYPKQLVMNTSAINALVASDNLVSGEIVVGYDRLFDIPTYSVPDNSTTNTELKMIVGDFSKYMMFEAEDDGDTVQNQPVDEGGMHGLDSKHKTVSRNRLDDNTVQLTFADITGGSVTQALTFMTATGTIGTPSSFTLDVSKLNGGDVLV